MLPSLIKKNMKIKLLLLVLFLINFNSFSQTNQERMQIINSNNNYELSKIIQNKKLQFKKDKANALSMAKIKGWQVFIDKPGKSFSELMRLDQKGNPIYYTTYNYGAGLTSRVNHLYSGGSLGLNIEGQNMIAGEWDGGGVLLTHELFEGRVAQMDGASSTHYHSTHVAGTIMGTDQVQGGSARGMAFKANLHAYEWNSDQAEVAQAAANGLLISNHSYGYNPGYLELHQFGKYEADANAFDDIMYNAPYYLFVAAAGNARDDGINSGDGGYDLLSGHSCTKNSMIVAAVHELTNYTGASSVNMSYFSSWGPTDDGRIKPDISAKGVDTFSASDNNNSDYITISGTSMASPSVTGTLLLMQQYYSEQKGKFMHSSTLRGLALHTADEAGNNPGPDYEFGWGLINAKKATEVITNDGLLSHISEETLNQGSSFSMSFDALGTEPLMATICWTDPAGNIITNSIEDYYEPSLVNDLDIRITQNGNTYYPWKLDPNNLSAAATQGDNVVDNIEKVHINNPVGSYTLTVTHKGTLQSGSQNFSVIVSGISFNDFYITSSNKKQNICEGDNIAQFSLDLSTISGFSDTVNFSVINLPLGVNASFSPASLSSAGNFTLDLTNLSGLASGIYPFTIHGQSSSDIADLDVELQVYGASFTTQILSSPTDNSTSMPLEVDFLWEENLNAQQYFIQIATDSSFTNIIENGSISSTSFQATTLNYNTTYYWRVQPINICGDGSFSSVYSFTTVCLGPTNVITSNALLDSVDVSWTENSGGSNWEIEIVEAGNSPIGIGSLVNTNPYTLTGLNSSTEYTVYVRSDCGNGNYSEWGVSLPFTTAADFCSGDHFYDTGGVSGSYSNNENTVTTIAPSIGFNTVSVQFNTFSLESCCDYLQIYDGSDTNAPLIGSYTSNPGTITSSNTNGTLTFLFHSDSSITYDGWDATVTCINISCPNPSNIEALNISPTSVNLNWAAGDTETDWEIEYDIAGFSQGSGTIVQTSTNPFALTGLTQDTNYDVYLRANCGLNPGDDDSSWIGPITFTTLVSCPQPTNFSSTNITLNSVDLSWIAGNTETDWEIEYDVAGFSQGSGTLMQLNSNTQTLTGLVYNTNYDVYLRANCGISPGDDDSNWVGPITFKTLDTVAPSNLTAEINQTNGEVTLNWSENSGFYEDFTDGVANNWIPVTGDWNVSNSTYNATRTTHDTSSSYYNQDFSSFEFEMRAKKNGGGSCNISMYFNGDPSSITATGNWDNAYSLMYCTNGSWKLVKIINGNWTSIVDWTSSSAINTGNNWNVLKVVYVDGYINAYINNVLLGSYYDVTFPSGKVGIKMYDNADNDIDLGNFDYISLIDLSNTTANYTFNIEEPNNSRNIYNFGDCNNEETCGNNEIIDIETTPIPKYGNSYTYRNNIIQAFQNYKIYRDGIEIGTSTPTTYLDQLPTYGTYEYHITSMYDEGESNPSNTVMVTWYTCPQPTDFSETNITPNSVDLSWVAGNTETDWEIEYGLAGFTQGTGTAEQTTINPFTLTGLNGDTSYDVYLRANCGAIPGDDDSLWVGPISFTTLISCPVPTNFNASNETTNTVELSWIAGNTETNWEIEYGLSGFTQGSGAIEQVATNPYILSGLNSSTNYDVYLRANCGTIPGDDDSVWVGPISFITACDVFIAPFNENFTDYSIPNCWTQSGSEYWNFNTGAAYQAAYAGDHTPGGGTNYAWIDGSTPNGTSQISTLKTPIIDISNLSVPQVSFSIFSLNSSGNYYNTLDVEFYDGANWNILLHLQESNGGWTDYTYVLTNYTIVGDIQLRFTIAENSPSEPYNNDILIDDVTIDEAPTCPKPTGFSENNINVSTVDLSWTAGNTETDWEIEYGLTGFTQGTGNIEQTTINPFTLTGLNGDTSYDVYLRANCGANPGDDDSIWVGPISFTTLISCPQPTSLVANNITQSSVDLSWIAGNTEANWEIEYGLSGFTQGSGTIEQVATNPYILSGLNSSTNYDIYLRANCGANPGDDDSVWVGPINLTTLCDTFTAPFTENFTNYGVPNCWSQSGSEYWNFSTNAAYAASYAGDHTTGGGTNYAWIDGSSPNGASQISTLFSPMIDISSLNVPMVNFSVFSVNSTDNNYNTLDVEFYDGANWNNLLHLQDNNGGWTEYEYTLSSYNITGDIQLRFTITENSPSEPYNNDILIDDIGVNEAPSCPKPTNFIENNITASTVDLSWTAGNTETDWEIEYGTAGFAQGSGTTIQVSTNPFTLSGLNVTSTYDVYLRANCGVNPSDDDSVWVGPITFTTSALEYPYNLTADLNETTGEVILNWNQTTGFHDDFISDTNWINVNGNWNVTNGNKNISSSTAQASSTYYNLDFSNFEFESRMRKTSGSDCNMALYFNGDPNSIDSNGYWNNTYKLLYCTNGAWTLVKIVNGNWTLIQDWVASGDINTSIGAWNTLKISVANGYFDVRINGVLQGTYFDNTFTSGKVGISMADANNNGTAEFDFAYLEDLNSNYAFGDVNQSETRNVYDSYPCYNCNVDPIGTEQSPNPSHGQTYVYEANNTEFDFTNFNVYRDDSVINTTLDITYTDQLPSYGTYNYYITSVYDEGESNPSNTVEVIWSGTPNIIVNPLSLHETLEVNETSTQILNISNTGDDSLDYSILTTVVPTRNIESGYWVTETDNLTPREVENSLENITISPEFSKKTYFTTNSLLNILVLEQGTFEHTYYVEALTNLGLSFTQVFEWNVLENELNNGTNWDLVIVNSYGSHSYDNVLTDLNNHLLNDGYLIYADWSVYQTSTHPIFNVMGVSFINSISAPINFSSVDSNHQIFNNPNIINSFNWTDDTANIDGQIVDVINSGTQLAAFDGNPTSGAIILNSNQNSLFNSFQSDNFQGDDNANGKDDMVELIENEISFFIDNSWLSTTPTSGTVFEGTSVDIDVHFDATDLTAGTYNGNIKISSNDPDEPIVNVPVELIVTDSGALVNDLSNFNFNYFPNPFENKINLTANTNFTSVKIYSLLGQELIKITPENKSMLTIDTSKLSIGTYFMRVEIDGKIASMKMIKK